MEVEMKNWIKYILASFLLLAAFPLSALAADSESAVLTVDKNDVGISLDIPEGKTETITSLRLQLLVSANSGSMGMPSFKFEDSIKSLIKDADITKTSNGSYQVDLILSGKDNQEIFVNSEYAKLGTLSVQPTSKEYQIKVEIIGDMDSSDEPVVRYVDGSGLSAMTVPLSTSPVLIQSQPEAPEGLDFGQKPVLETAVKAGARRIRFKWSKIIGAEGYVLYEYNTKTKKYKGIKTISDPSVNYYAKNFGYATTHSFKVRAYKKAANGSKAYGKFSDVKKVTLPPASTKKFIAKYQNTSKVTLVWKKVSKAKGYQIFRSQTKRGKYKLIKTIKKGSATTCLNIRQANGKTAYYKIRAYITDSNGKRIYGKLSGARIARPRSPRLRASVNAGNVTLNWNKVPRADGYYVYRCKKNSEKFVLIKTITGSSNTTYTETPPQGSGFRYKVRAFERLKKGTNLSGYPRIAEVSIGN